MAAAEPVPGGADPQPVAAVAEPATGTLESGVRRADPAARPSIILDDLHVTYQVRGEKRVANAMAGGRRSLLPERFRRSATHGTQQVRALRGVDLVARHGDVIGLVGSNGSGKSTMLLAIAGLLSATDGKVYTSARPSLLGVNAALMNDLSGERNIVLGCLAMGMSPEEIDERFQSIVDFSGIGRFVSLPMNTYSSGMAARLRFAIAASVTHEILLIDEALSTGDANFQRRSQERIEELRDEAGTVIIVSHALTSIRENCNRGVWLNQGKILMQGEVEEVLEAYENRDRDPNFAESVGGLIGD
ncbi:MAG: ABC transporter ATP-binding protein [Actinomycetota bacterium]|nr:MAG: ABC transporter ATP-binding protein [Actinomycetota bacterium]